MSKGLGKWRVNGIVIVPIMRQLLRLQHRVTNARISRFQLRPRLRNATTSDKSQKLTQIPSNDPPTWLVYTILYATLLNTDLTSISVNQRRHPGKRFQFSENTSGENEALIFFFETGS
jgi:hypothetical protein